jgi:ActR/RegA family two-component response regulator
MTDEISLLFVDDEDSIRATLPPILEKYGFKVTTAATVAEAMTLIAQRKFEVLLTDLNIGYAGDGFAIVSAMRSTQPEALRFLLTGYPAFESALEAIRQQVDDYIVKPAETERLVQTIRSQLAKRKPAQLMPPKRLPEVIREQSVSIVQDFLQSAAADPQMSSIPMSDAERTDHIPRLLSVAMRIVVDGNVQPEDRDASAQHGTLRRKQGYTVPLLIREARMLKDAVASCVQGHLLEIDISYLVRDMVAAFGTIDILLEESVQAFLHALRTPSSATRSTAKKGRTQK